MRVAGLIVLLVGGIAVVAFLHPMGLTLGPLSVPVSFAAQPKPVPLGTCDPVHPTFLYGFKALSEQLGATMGTAVNCEHAIHVDGDTRQDTTTGYAYYRKSSNVPAFTNGWDHWALTPAGLVHWTGDVVDPPTTPDRLPKVHP